MGSVLEIPGYKAALEKESFLRDAAFLSVTENVGGFQCRPLTLRDFLTLRMMKSPFIYGTTPAPEHVAQFLWLLSPKFSAGGGLRTRWHKRQLMRRCRRFVPPPAPLWTSKRIEKRHAVRLAVTLKRAAQVVQAIQDFVKESLQDMQPGGGPEGCFQAAHYSDGAAICATFAREYGWPEAAILEMPMKRILQYVKEIRRHNDSKVPLCNPSDQVRADWMIPVEDSRIARWMGNIFIRSTRYVQAR